MLNFQRVFDQAYPDLVTRTLRPELKSMANQNHSLDLLLQRIEQSSKLIDLGAFLHLYAVVQKIHNAVDFIIAQIAGRAKMIGQVREFHHDARLARAVGT